MSPENILCNVKMLDQAKKFLIIYETQIYASITPIPPQYTSSSLNVFLNYSSYF